MRQRCYVTLIKISCPFKKKFKVRSVQLQKGYIINFAMEKLVKKHHAVCIPYPAQSHINAMLKFAKILHCKGFHITFVNTEYNHNRILKSRGPNSLDGSADFRFETIPDGLPPVESDDATQDVFQLCISIGKNCHAPFLQLLKDLNYRASMDDDASPVTCIISDCVMSFTLEASEELGIPNAQLWTVNAISAMCMLHYPHLKERGYTPLKGIYVPSFLHRSPSKLVRNRKFHST